MTTRSLWTRLARQIAEPVLRNMAAGRLRRVMPVECVPGHEADRAIYTHLEAIGRTLAGLSPWLQNDPEAGDLRADAVAALDHATRPESADACNFTRGAQPLVDAAFVAHALCRAPEALGPGALAATDRTLPARLTEALVATRVIAPYNNNWTLFASMVEVGIDLLGLVPPDMARVERAFGLHAEWYKGDGHYGDGPAFHADYYNSYVIHPMLLDAGAHFAGRSAVLLDMQGVLRERARRYAAVLERLVAPDGTFPAVGRSIAYRAGAFQLLAQLALQRALPTALSPAQVRGALTAVIRRTLEVPGAFDDGGFLRIGLAGHQPRLAETYISTGSLYLTTTAFLPLGLAASDPFWADADVPYTGQQAWSGADVVADCAIKA